MERRRHYRVTSEFRKEVIVEVQGTRGSWWVANLVDISVGGAALVLEDAARYTMRRGDKVVLRFRSDRLRTPLEIPSQIYYVRGSSGPHRIGIGFDDWEDSRSTLPLQLRSLFNQRQAFRVSVDVQEPIDVHLELESRDTPLPARARDFSILGVGAWISHRDAELFFVRQNLHVSFELPGHSTTIRVGAVVRHLGETGPQRSLGLEIIADSRFDMESRKALRDYVMHRQLQMRRKGVRND